jgi:hypothetical protein
MSKKLLAVMFLSSGLLVGSITGTFARTTGIVVYPSKFELSFPNSQERFLSKSVQVENYSNKTIRVKAYTQPWRFDKEGQMVFLDKPDEHSLTDNIRFNPSEFDIGPKQRQTVRFTVKVPDGEDGEYREIIFFKTMTGKSILTSSANKNVTVDISVESRFGTTIYVYKGKTLRNTTLTAVSLEKNKKDTYLTATMKNDGNVHNSIYGKVILFNKLDPSKNKEMPVRYYVMPQSTQKLKIQIPNNYAVNKNNVAQIHLNYLDENSKEQAINVEAEFGTVYTDVQAKNNAESN